MRIVLLYRPHTFYKNVYLYLKAGGNRHTLQTRPFSATEFRNCLSVDGWTEFKLCSTMNAIHTGQYRKYSVPDMVRAATIERTRSGQESTDTVSPTSLSIVVASKYRQEPFTILCQTSHLFAPIGPTSTCSRQHDSNRLRTS